LCGERCGGVLGLGRPSTHFERKESDLPAQTRFAMLLRLTPEGAKGEGTIQNELKNLTEAVGALGGRVDAAVVTLGAHDAVVVGHVESDEQLAWLAATAASCGLVSYETMRGFTAAEWAGIQGDAELHTALPFHK
jgi:uncharacterized protein with GYD domain